MNIPRSPDLSLIVNSYAKPRHLALVLESIALQRDADGRFELVVADDGSTDASAAMVAAFADRVSFPVTWTAEPHDGFRLARVRNRGAAVAHGETLLFLDGDSILPADHVAAHLARRRPGVAMLGDVIRLPEETCRDLDPTRLAEVSLQRLVPATEAARLRRRFRQSWFYNAIGHPSKPRLCGGNFAVWRSDYLRVNGSDELFRGWGQEDDDLGLRLRSAGIRLESILDRTSTLHVWHPTDPTATPRWRDGVNVPYFLRRGRLTRCRHGLIPRGQEAILWGLPSEAQGALCRAVTEVLAGAETAPVGGRCEIDIQVHPGGGRFIRPAECRVLLVALGSEDSLPNHLRRRADRMALVDPADASGIRALLADVG